MVSRIAKTSEHRGLDMNIKSLKPAGLILAGLFALLPALAGAATLERVRASNTLTLGYLPDLAPYTSDEGGKPAGFGIEICQKIAEQVKSRLGASDLQVRYQSFEPGKAADAIATGALDLLCTPTPETLDKRKVVSFSRPVYTAGLAVVVRADASPVLLRVLNGQVAHTGPTWRATINRGLANHTYAAVEGGTTEKWIREQMSTLGVIANLLTVKSVAEGVQQVHDGKADGFFAERMLLESSLLSSKDPDQLMVLDRIFEFAPVSLAMEREDEDFRLLVDSVISDLYRSGAYEQLYVQYFGEPGEAAKLLWHVYQLPDGGAAE